MTFPLRVGPSSVVVRLSARALGASFTSLMFTVTVALSLWSPSVMLYVKLSVPLKLGAGVTVTVLSALKVTLPLVMETVSPGLTELPAMVTTLKGSPSGSESLPRMAKVMGVSSGVLPRSSLAMGPSLLPATLKLSVVVSVAVPSETV